MLVLIILNWVNHQTTIHDKLTKYNQTQWQLQVNQSKNASDVLNVGNYTFNVFLQNDNDETQAGLRNVSIDYLPFNISFVNPTPADGFTQLISEPVVLLNMTVLTIT